VERTRALRILWLVPYNPWPRHHGGKLRTWALITGVATEGSKITVLYANDDGSPPPPPVKHITWREYKPRPRRTLSAKLRSAFSAYPEAAWVGWNADADRWIREHAPEFDVAVLEQAHMSIYARSVTGIPRLVLDAQNIEHRLVRQLADHQARFRGRARLLLDAAKFARIERGLFSRADLITACSDDDAAQVASMAHTARVVVRPNGVDLEEYRYQDPTDDLPLNVVMTGTLGYLPNLDAAHWIHDDIWPRIRAKVPKANLNLVGANCPPSLAALDAPTDGFNVVGFVEDVRPWLHRSRVFLMPLRAGSGTRLKALQAMAAGCPIVSTAQGVEGLGADGASVRIEETAEDLAEEVVKLLLDEAQRLAQARSARAHVERGFAWDRITADLRDDFESLRP
jgi:glycosyltransferase involved in cell wall biosynthesis